MSTRSQAPSARRLSASPPVPTTVTLMAWTRTGQDAFSALVNVPLPGVVLNVPGIGNRTTDQNGEFTIDISSPVNITVGALDGRRPLRDVLADAADPSEGLVRITSGITYGPAPSLDDTRVRLTLDALRRA